MRKLCLLLLLAVPAFAASPRDSMIVNAAWLKAHLNDSNLVLLHVGDQMDPKEYAGQHIPGAIQASMKDVSISDRTGKGLVLEMPPVDELKADLEKLGISDNSRIIVYYAKDWVSPTTRIIFTLDYAGLGDRTSLLDGGMPAWIAAGNETTTVVPTVKPGSLSALKIKPIVVDGDYVKSHLNSPGIAIVDGRDAVFYDGTEKGGDKDHRKAGHIAGAHSFPFTQLVDDKNFVRPASELAALFEKAGVKPNDTVVGYCHIAGAHSFPFTQLVDDKNYVRSTDDLAALFAKAGVKPSDTVVGYCHIGQQATAMLFAARLTGHPVFLYDGSFQDWSRHDDYPVDNPAAEKK